MVEIIVKYLFADNVPEEYKLKAFLSASEHGKMEALYVMVKSKSGDWPLDKLKEALGIARDKKAKHFIRKMICNQIFRGRPQKVRASGDCGHLITTLEWRDDN